MAATKFRRIAQLRTATDFTDHLRSLGITLPFDENVQVGDDAPLAQPLTYRQRTIGNRFSILPMEGWDGTADGLPTDKTQRRWENFGRSGAKLIWGGEAVAVRHDGRANANQLRLGDDTVDAIAGLHQTLVKAHADAFGQTNDLYVGLQLTHSGRFCRPNTHTLEPRIAYNHPLLDSKFGIDGQKAVFTDDEVDELIEDFIQAAILAEQAEFDFVDVKHCHGYLGHEFLSAKTRTGKYGGSFENRTQFLKNIVAGIRARTSLDIGVRFSAYDWIPFQPGEDGIGTPMYSPDDYLYAFGGTNGTDIDLTEPKQFLDLLAELDIQLVCITAGSPYYVPHIQRPALFPPSDGYLPPEDPLVGVARMIKIAGELKAYRPDLTFVGSGYSYLQDWLPNIAQRVVADGLIDSIGLGRMVLSYPDLPADVLAGNSLQRKRICRTFSDCTTAPRNGIISGCYPLDDYYKNSEHHEQLKAAKRNGDTY